MLKSIICPSFDPKVPLQHLVTSAPLLRGTKVGAATMHRWCFCWTNMPSRWDRKTGEGNPVRGMALFFFGWRGFFCAVVVVFWGFNEWSLVAQFLWCLCMCIYIYIIIYIYIHIHKLNLDQSFLGLPNFDPGGYDTIYETQEELWWNLRL